MNLSMFLTGDGNYHMAGWRLPGARVDGGHSIRFWRDAARIMERGKIDMMFIADGADLDALSYTSRIDRMDLIAILSAVSMVTTRLGLGAAISITFNEPCNIARIIALPDHISEGREFRKALARGEEIVRAGGVYVIDARLDVNVPEDEERGQTAGRIT
jgi:alkanesulfonate monooxygenase SsuD/methylene tetrahydromethanopterin reductase-like flavin-dependent oxidoreductase (luciferase family)